MKNEAGFIRPNVVKAFVEGRKSKGQFGTVIFLKTDGTTRTINGCFAPISKIIGSEKGILQGKQMEERGQIPIYDVSAKAWKSFYADRVVDII